MKKLLNIILKTDVHGSLEAIEENLSKIDLQEIKDIQAIDIVSGFYKPDQYRKFDIEM